MAELRWPIAILAAAVLAASGAAIVRQGRTAEPAPAAAVTPAPVAASILFVGDGYPLGQPYLPDLGYACRAATLLDADCDLAAEADTGYINGGPGHRLPLAAGTSSSFAERIPALRARYAPAAVVFDGGRADLPYGAGSMQNAMRYTLDLAAQAWPDARIAVVLPWSRVDPDLRRAIAADRALARIAVIDPGEARWPERTLDAAGQAAVGAALAAGLRAAGVGAGSGRR